MRIIFFMLALVTVTGHSNTIENSELNPQVEEPQMPGTPVPLKELNTSPNPTPSKNTSEKFRGTLHTGKNGEVKKLEPKEKFPQKKKK